MQFILLVAEKDGSDFAVGPMNALDADAARAALVAAGHQAMVVELRPPTFGEENVRAVEDHFWKGHTR